MRRCTMGLIGLVLSACQDEIDLDPLDDSPVVEARVRPKPIIGGTLAIAGDVFAVAADPDRDVVHVVDIDAEKVRHTIALEPGDEPGRVVTWGVDTAHVVLRGFGGIATIDLVAGTVTARRALCTEPRGLAVEPSEGTLHVACADGSLIHLDPSTGTELGRTILDSDLRDVVLRGSEVLASRFRAAELVGAATRQQGPGGDFVPHVAWRTIDAPQLGGIAMLHQRTDTHEVPIISKSGEGGDGGDDAGGGGGGDFAYGGGPDPCVPPITGPVLSIFSDERAETIVLPDVPLAVDVAISPDGDWLALATPGAEAGTPTMRLQPTSGGCFPSRDDPSEHPLAHAQITAVAFTSEGVLVSQSREPAQLLIQRAVPNGGTEVVTLQGESRFDTGHEIFHRVTESGLSCASCHPEGTDDGHVWRFEQLGARRTQPLDIGLADTAPFHWDGEMDDLDVLMSEVLAHRMGGKRQSSGRADSFARWLFEQGRPAADNGREDATLVAEGEALFASFSCARCHSGAMLGGANSETFAGAELQVPSLRRVSLRPPFMHDGRSATLEDAVRDMLDHTIDREATADEVAALTAYMRTL